MEDCVTGAVFFSALLTFNSFVTPYESFDF